jgi:hypothetical protein
MSDSERKIFPVESVLALVCGKEDADVKEIAGYMAGRSLQCDCCAKTVGMIAASWLTRLYPKFADLVWDKDEDWGSFVSRCAGEIGDKISLPAMDGRWQANVEKLLAAGEEMMNEKAALQAEVAKLSAQVEALKPFEGKLADAQKKADKLDEQLKALKKDMGGMRRQLAGFEGKMAVDQEELLDAIKDAIKTNLKSVTIAAGGAAAGAAAAAEGEAPAEGGAASDDFGFGGDSGSSDDFGFGGSSSSDGFGF